MLVREFLRPHIGDDERVHAQPTGQTPPSPFMIMVLNATSGLYRAADSRQRSDGGEISRFTVTYLVTDGLVGRRISALVIHSP